MLKDLFIENIHNSGKDIKIHFNDDINILIGNECTYKTSVLEYIYNQEKNSIYIDHLNHMHKRKEPYRINFIKYHEILKELNFNFNSTSHSQMAIINILHAASYCSFDYILLIDNIEIFLNIDQQRNIINNIKKITDCQIICSTQSPTIYYQGWIDKIIRMEETIKETKYGVYNLL